MIKVYNEQRSGVHTFGVSSASDSDRLYPVVYIVPRARSQTAGRVRGSRRGGWSCGCNDWQFVGQIEGVHCKHIKLVRTVIAESGGFSKVLKGRTLVLEEAT